MKISPGIGTLCFFSAFGAVFEARVMLYQIHATAKTPYLTLSRLGKRGQIVKNHLHPSYLHATPIEAHREAEAFRNATNVISAELAEARKMNGMAPATPKRNRRMTLRLRQKRPAPANVLTFIAKAAPTNAVIAA